MKSFPFFLLFSLSIHSLGFSSRIADSIDDSIVHVAFYSKIYTQPSINSSITYICEDSTPLKILKIQGEWLKIDYQLHQGWIQKNNIIETVEPNKVRYIDKLMLNSASKNRSTSFSAENIYGYMAKNMPFINVLLLCILLFVIFFTFQHQIVRVISFYPRTKTQVETIQSPTPGAENCNKPEIYIPSVNYRLHGTIQDYSLYDVIQMLEMTNKNGTLYLKNISKKEIGKLIFKDGKIIFANFENYMGRNAVSNILKLSSGSFGFVAHYSSEIEPNCMISPTEIMLNNAKSTDEEIWNTKGPFSAVH